MTRARFLTLDAMRGVAALAVVSIHFAGRFSGPMAQHGFLAVDAFFVLSGFVLAMAYDGRLQRGELNFRHFMVLRVKRLAPLFSLGLGLGVVAHVVNGDPALTGMRFWASLALNAAAIPGFPASNGNFFALNHPFWSLFFEIWVANLLFGLFWRQLHGRTLAVVVALSGLGLIVAGVRTGSIAGGWAYPTLALGFFRVGFSFFAGVMVARRFRLSPPRLSLPAPAIILALASVLAFPYWGHKGLAAELIGVLVVFPLLTFYGAGASHMPAWIGRKMGDASYAAYTIHFPLLALAAAAAGPWVKAHRTPAQVLFLLAIIGLSLVAAEWDDWVRRAGRWAPSARPA